MSSGNSQRDTRSLGGAEGRSPSARGCGAPGRSARRWVLALGCAGSGLLALAGACATKGGSEDDTEACEPGARRACDCDDDHRGAQTCRGDGLDYLPCDCTDEIGGAGGGGSADTAGSAGTAQCVDEGASCERSGDCCSYPDGACVDFGDAPECAASCDENAACESGCCVMLDDYSGACAEAERCGEGEADSCRADGVSCDESADCCGFEAGAAHSYCLELDRGGPGVCSPRCDDDTDCGSECCLALENGDSACFPAEDCA